MPLQRGKSKLNACSDPNRSERTLGINAAELSLVVAVKPGDDIAHVPFDPNSVPQSDPIDKREFGPLEQRPALAEKARRGCDEDRLHGHTRLLGDQCEAALEFTD